MKFKNQTKNHFTSKKLIENRFYEVIKQIN